MADVAMSEAVAVAGAALLGGGCRGAAPAARHDADTNAPATDAVPYGPGPTAYDPGRYSDSINRDLDAMENYRRAERNAGRPVGAALDADGAGDGQKDGNGDAVAVQAVSELGDYQRTTAREVDADIERLTRQLADARKDADNYCLRLDGAIAERNSVLSSYAAEIGRLTDRIPCVRCQRDAAQRELAEIKRVLSDYHQQVGTGILAVKKLAKRIYEQTAGGTRRPADYPAVTPPAGAFSVCAVGIHEPGGPCPPGYMDRQEWHRVQQKAGHRQIYRPCCGLWLYPFEPHEPFCSAGREASA